MAELISLISGIITLLDFGCKVVSGTRSVRESLHGKAPDVHELSLVLDQIQLSHQKYQTRISASRKKGPDYENALAIMKECEGLHRDLKEVIGKLQMSNTAFSKTLDAWRVSIRRIRKDKYLGALRDRLLRLDQHVSRVIEREMHEERHASIMAELKAMEKEKTALGIVTRTTMNLAQADILELVKKGELSREVTKQKSSWDAIGGHRSGAPIQRRPDPSNRGMRGNNADLLDDDAEAEEMQLATRIQQLTIVKVKLEVLQREQAASLKEIEIVRSLYFTEVFRRFGKIPEADAISNKWVFDPRKTTFPEWLESRDENDGLYYIFGKPGSGKSTLMKFLSEHESTQQALKRWAGTLKLHTATYYFWNQGSEMQKSGIGLLQSLLYQILRHMPDLITAKWSKRPHHEAWTMTELRATFERIAKSTLFESRFCFFIDGLDEYDGDEEDLVDLLEVLAAFRHIKICASSRPRQQHETLLMKRNGRAFDIAKFTQNDMRNHVRKELDKSTKFCDLATTQPECAQIMADISAWANGVWLWVHLVTKEIRYEVDRGEKIETLRKIVNDFPSDLEAYFTRIIEKVKPRYKEQMAQIFLITVEELQPLPLHAFALLEQEQTAPHYQQYAIKAKIEPFTESQIKQQYPDLQSRVQNRTSDFLVVDDMPHPVCLSHSVDFFHRTGRDFLRDNYRRELDKLVKPQFNPLISLCNISLALLKGAQINDFLSRESLKVIIGLTDELLYYAHELEKRFGDSEVQRLVPVLDELDKTNTAFARRNGGSRHWTHARDLPPAQGRDIYKEGGSSNFLALAVQARLTGYVRAKLQANQRCLIKSGRPLLDYALRPLRTTPIAMPYHSVRDEPSIDIAMVMLLLEHGADPNQPVYLHSSETVWGLFLISINETALIAASTSSKKSWFQTCRALIRAGAQPNYTCVQCELTVSGVIECVFTTLEVEELRKEIAQKERELEAQKPDGRWWPFKWPSYSLTPS